MDNFDVIEYEFNFEPYRLEPFGIDGLASAYCTLFVEEQYVVGGEFMLELNRKDDKTICRLLDKEVRAVLKKIEQQDLRNLIVIDKIAQAIEKVMFAYSKNNPYIKVVKISIDDFVTTYSDPELQDLLSDIYDDTQSQFMDMMDFDDEGDLEDFFLNNLDLLGDGLEGFDFGDDKPNKDNKILKFPNGDLPF